LLSAIRQWSEPPCRKRGDGIESKAGSWSAENETAFKTPIREQFEQQGHPCHASARLCGDTGEMRCRRGGMLGLGLSAVLNEPAKLIRFGVFRK